MRPRAINLFAIAFASQALLALLHGIVTAGGLREQTIEALAPLGDMAVPLVLAVRLAIAALLTWAVLFRASKVAKWAATILILGRLFHLPAAWAGIVIADGPAILWAAAFLLGLLAIACLFEREARLWFAAKGRQWNADAAVFE